MATYNKFSFCFQFLSEIKLSVQVISIQVILKNLVQLFLYNLKKEEIGLSNGKTYVAMT